MRPVRSIPQKKIKKEMVRAIAIDLDGCVHNHKNPVEGKRMGPPVEGAKEALESFKKGGYKIIIFSVWGDEKGQKTIADYMKFYDLPFDLITNIKPNAIAYIDDKGIRFTDWKEVLKQIYGRKST